MPGSFVHLHNHTEYSLLDGAVHIKDLIAECSRMGMPAVAVTDHGNLFGAIELVMETASINPWPPGTRSIRKDRRSRR